MGKVLSQEEIDALLSDAKKGKDIESLGKEKKVVEYLYDWKMPQKINTEHRRQLKQIFGIFTTSFSTYLQTTLKSIVDVNLIDISTVGYSDYLLSISEPTCMYKLYLDKIKAHTSIEVQPAFVFFLVDRLLGGIGQSVDINRAISPIEESIMLRIMQNCFLALKEAWKSTVPGLNFQYNGFEYNPNFVNIAPSTDVVAIFAFEVSIKEEMYNFTICFPSRALDPILEKLSTSSWQTQENISRKNINVIEDYIKFSKIDVSVEIGRLDMSVREIMELEKDDVIELNKPIHAPMLLRVDDRAKYFVKAGVEGNKKAFEMVRPLTPVEERKYENR